MTQLLTLRELSQRVGVDVAHLKRMIRIGSLPEASKHEFPDGRSWAIPSDVVPELANRHGWDNVVIDLTVAERQTDEAEDDVERAATQTTDLVLHTQEAVEPAAQYARSDEEVTVAEIIDSALLTRLLGAQDERADAEARARESQRAMAAMAEGRQRVVRELAEERYERQRTSDRLRDERTARMVTDGKMAEMRARLEREQAVADTERRARTAATRRSIEAEREAAAALAALGWWGRRRLERRLQHFPRP